MKKSPSFRLYVLLSLIAHIVGGAAFLITSQFKAKPQEAEAVSIQLLNPEEFKKLAEADKKLESPSVPANQIVEQSEVSANEEAPEDSRFLSAKNQKVEKQTIAQQRGQFQNIKKSSPEKSGTKGDGQLKQAKSSEEVRKEVAKNLFKTFDANEALERQKVAENKTGEGLGKGQGEQNTGADSDVSQSNDYIKDVESGLETVLNTREFKYYSYYNRIRRQLSQHWEGKVRERLSRMFKEGRAPAAANQDRITKLMIVLNDKGTLFGVQVISDSGVRDLDEAAIEAFRAAAPFPNPPQGIVEGDGTVKIRWDFILET
ncbi:putative periplasmic protein TonB [Bdellovibrio bacteriovorus W]|nr:putative periplasmic protein TonB [Bdellovibrio bacteriovorus W]